MNQRALPGHRPFQSEQAAQPRCAPWTTDSCGRGPPRAIALPRVNCPKGRDALQSYSNVLLGLILWLLAWPLALGAGYPRWLGWCAAGSGTAWIARGAAVAYIGLFDSVARLIAILLLAVTAFMLSVQLW